MSAWNRSADKASALVAEGVEVAGNAAQAAADADVVICMLSSGPVCDEVLLSENGGVLAAMRKGSTLIVMSSIPVETARSQAARAAEMAFATSMRPCLVARREHARALWRSWRAVKPAMSAALADVFAPMGRATHVGPVGAGQLAKLANQLIVASNICAVAEALVLAESGGADPARVREALLGGFANSTVFRQHGQRMVEGNFVPGGPAKYQVKDTGTALALAGSLGLKLPVATEVDRIFRSLVEHGGGDLDHSAAILELRRINRDREVAQPRMPFQVERTS